MGAQSDYLPAGLPHNRGLWPQAYRDLENLDLKASRLIKQLKLRKISRATIFMEIEKTPGDQREFFRTRLNYWREVMNP
ncbi:hypothetical protein AB204_01115 [Xenorhabdus khoisanae]|uniref:Uncharacterized protein n=1 Tax=Xenorhabdus khoisanae TaxID=880157 RepID=A0A0J5FYB3_9GAMM|nr:hypothetical protein [Xenorhabdus khoisanae]KMJ46922.1 hypothetical protein AB204_01115 [Xenorhabdus khoisanae]